jgi:beta-lactamase superfamily II metal-dependent hydrolase
MMKYIEDGSIGAPDPEQVEIAVFGPNYGECILVHLGASNWVVIDSCTTNGVPAALSYLSAIKVDPSTAIKWIVITHWHDDHCRGLSKLIAAAPSATLCVASALTEREFLTFRARMSKNRTTIAGTKLVEFSATIDEIAHRARTGALKYILADARSSLLKLRSSDTTLRVPCEMYALSPSHADKLDFFVRLAAMMPLRRTTKRSISAVTPNEVSMVTLINVGQSSILLGRKRRLLKGPEEFREMRVDSGKETRSAGWSD